MFVLYFVESPMQLLSAVSHRKQNKKRDCKYYLFINFGSKKRKENYQQIKAIHNKNIDLWNDVEELYFYSDRVRSTLLFFYKTIFYIKKYGKQKSMVFNGDYRNIYFSLWSKLLSKDNKEILLDDGCIVVVLQLLYFNNSQGLYTYLKTRGRSNLYLVSLYKMLFKFDFNDSPPNLYSDFIFNQGLSSKQVNIKKIKSKKVSKEYNEDIYFFGSKYSESSLLLFDDEIKLIERAFDELKDKGVFFYIPHREDSNDKINAIKNKGIKIKWLNKPCEEFFMEENILPYTIAGFYTTSLYNLNLSYDFKSVISFDISRFLTDKNIAINASLIYEYYKETNINVVNF